MKIVEMVLACPHLLVQKVIYLLKLSVTVTHFKLSKSLKDGVGFGTMLIQTIPLLI